MKHLTLRMTFALGCLWATILPAAESFGGLEAAFTHDSNFLASPSGAQAGAEDYFTFSGHLGGYWPSADQRTAFILRGDAALVLQDEHDALDRTDFGVSAGVYHAFSRRHSMTATAGLAARRYDDGTRDTDLGSVQLGLKQKTSETFWFREALLIERADAQAAADRYDGYTLQGSLNWGPTRATLYSLSLARSARTYDSAPGVERTGWQFGAGLVHEFDRRYYLRAGYTRLSDETSAGVEYDSNIVTVAVGAGF
jgi:hypothetical protein